MTDLSTKYAGLNLSNPVIAASSGLTDSVHKLQELEKAGVGAVVLKSIFEEEILMEMDQVSQQMTGKPFVFPETMDYMDEEPHEDLIRKYLRFVSEAKAALKIPVIASINCISNQKWTYLAHEIEKAGADALELNLFSLPSTTEMPSSEVEEMCVELVEKVVSEVKIPVTVKISYYFTTLGSMISRLGNTGINGMVLFNRYYSPDIDIKNEAISGTFLLSSNSEMALPLRWIALMSDSVNVSFAASSGFQTGESVVKAILAGASAVQLATIIYKKGMDSIGEIKNFITNWMKDKKYKSIEDFRGKLNYKGLVNTASWERVQFMREFRHFVK